MNKIMSKQCENAIKLLWLQTDIKKFPQAHKYLYEAIDLGDIEAYYFLGHCYGYNEGFECSKENHQKFLKLYLTGAELGSARCVLGLVRAGLYKDDNIKKCKLSLKEAFDKVLDMALADDPYSCYQIGNAYYRGDVRHYNLADTQVSYSEEAKKWLERASKGGILMAVNSLATFYYNRKDYQKAYELYMQGVKANYSISICNVARMYESGIYLKKDAQKAFEYYKLASQLGYNDAISELARCYLYGIGVEKNYEKALYWFNLSAKEENIEGINGLAYCNYYGYGCEIDYVKSKELFEKAANRGSSFAIYRLGVMYSDGKGVNKDLEKASCYFELAAKMGLDVAQNAIGNCYFEGKGVPINLKLAFDWYELGAKQGYLDCMDNVAYCSYYGYGCVVDYKKAKEIFELNSKKNDAYATYQLGVMYEEGNGVDKNTDKAVEFYNKSYKLGYNKAKQKVEKLSKRVFTFTKEN